MRWTREVAKSGPGDTLDGRWRVRRDELAGWCVIDMQDPSGNGHGRHGSWTIIDAGFRTMREARKAAEMWRACSRVM